MCVLYTPNQNAVEVRSPQKIVLKKKTHRIGHLQHAQNSFLKNQAQKRESHKTQSYVPSCVYTIIYHHMPVV